MTIPPKTLHLTAAGRRGCHRHVSWPPSLRPLRITMLAVCGALVLYVAAFVWRFDVLSDPVRNNQNGWLGPQIRGDKYCVDIGKVLYYGSDDISPYRGVFRPLCKVWIWVNGF